MVVQKKTSDIQKEKISSVCSYGLKFLTPLSMYVIVVTLRPRPALTLWLAAGLHVSSYIIGQPDVVLKLSFRHGRVALFIRADQNSNIPYSLICLGVLTDKYKCNEYPNISTVHFHYTIVSKYTLSITGNLRTQIRIQDTY